MRSTVLVLALCGLVPAAAQAKHRRHHHHAAPAPRAYEAEISHYARMHGIPDSLVHRVILRESRYNPRLVGHHRHYGLMQLSYATARSMGYDGPATGLLDPLTNLAYGVPYLANAYAAAGQSEAGAMRLYASGYYYVAKRRGLLPALRTADSPSLAAPEPAAAPPPPPPPDNPFVSLFRAVTEAPAAPRASEAPPAP